MEYSVKSGLASKQRTACIVVGVYDSRKLSKAAKELDDASAGYISNIIRKGDMEGKLGQVLLLHNVPGLLADRVLLVGAGSERELDEFKFKSIIKTTVKTLDETGAMEAVCCLADLNLKNRLVDWKISYAITAVAEHFYNFDMFAQKRENARRPLRKLTFQVQTRKELSIAENGMTKGIAIAGGINLTKTLADTPPNICTPQYLEKTAKELAKKQKNFKTKVLQKNEIEKLGMGSFLAVAKGSPLPPVLITMEYNGASKKDKPVVLVGKGVTFDSGGTSIKPREGMVGMKYDMCGAATVLGVMQAASDLELPINLKAVIPSCENTIGGHASRPDDVVVSMSGQSIEILNTDAEGRLILCDALTYCERYNPEVVIDIATLTGACILALGPVATGLFSNHNPLAHELLNASNIAADKAWQLPIWEEYANKLESKYADFANVSGREGAASIAACFLAKFTKKYNWAHLDIAGTAAYYSAGSKRASTGRPIPMLMQYLINKCESKTKTN